jgi:hypothetical protein
MTKGKIQPLPETLNIQEIIKEVMNPKDQKETLIAITQIIPKAGANMI